MALDTASAVATIVALFVASFALLISSAQAILQLMSTSQLLRMCDGTVFAGAPGGGHRVWLTKQFRFRVIYKLPCLTLLDICRASAAETKSFHSNTTSYPPLGYKDTSPPLTLRGLWLRLSRPGLRALVRENITVTPGEACWVSFIRCAQESTYREQLRYFLITGDADRCPADLPNIPMPVNLKDVVIIGLRMGLKITGASLRRKTISMQGSIGSITSSYHPVLGVLVHFTPRLFSDRQYLHTGILQRNWLQRIQGDCHVAGKSFRQEGRSRVEASERIWKIELWRAEESISSRDSASGLDLAIVKLTKPSHQAPTPRRDQPLEPPGRNAHVLSDLPQFLTHTTGAGSALKTQGEQNEANPSSPIPRSIHDGPWRLVLGTTSEGLAKHSREGTIRERFSRSSSYSPMREHEAAWYRHLRNVIQRVRSGCSRLRVRPSHRKTLSDVEGLHVANDVPSATGVANEQTETAITGSNTTGKDNAPDTPQYKNADSPMNPNSFDHDREGEQLKGSAADTSTNHSVQLMPEGLTSESDPPDHQEQTTTRTIDLEARWASAHRKQRGRRKAASQEEADGKIIQEANINERKRTDRTRQRRFRRLSDKEHQESRSDYDPEEEEGEVIRKEWSEDKSDEDLGQTSGLDDEFLEKFDQIDDEYDQRSSQKRQTEHEDNGEPLRIGWVDDEYDDGLNHNPWVDDRFDEEYLNERRIVEHSRERYGRDLRVDDDTDENFEENIRSDNDSIIYEVRRTARVDDDSDKKRTEASEIDKDIASQATLSASEGESNDIDTPGTKEEKALEISAMMKQKGRDEKRAERDRAFRDRHLDYDEPPHIWEGPHPWFWTCQADIMPGVWATPWVKSSEEVCIGATAVILETLMGFTKKDISLVYVDYDKEPPMLSRCLEWYKAGKTTYPGYAINARSGIVVGGDYNQVKFEDFSVQMPPIELLANYEYQVTKHYEQSAAEAEADVIELMNLDSWLSLASRTTEIQRGRGNLVRNAPKLVQHVMSSFEEDFQEIDLVATEGGYQLIAEVSSNLLDMLSDERLSQAEQLFLVVAMLRATKYATCVTRGPSTFDIEDLTEWDFQVNMV